MTCLDMMNSVAERCINLITGSTKLERLLSGSSFLDHILGFDSLINDTTPSCANVRIIEEHLRLTLSKSEIETILHKKDITEKVLVVYIQNRYNVNHSKKLEYVVSQILKSMKYIQTIRIQAVIALDQSNYDHQKALDTITEVFFCKTLEAFEGKPKNLNELGLLQNEGILDLSNLAHFAAKHRRRCVEVYQAWYQCNLSLPFSAPGLQITKWIMEFVEERMLNIFFYANQEDPLYIVGVVYSFIFLEFSRRWHLLQPKDSNQFATMSARFKTQIRETINGLTDATIHSEWGMTFITGADLTMELSCWIDGEVHPHKSKRLLNEILQL